jgi:hypothetical protein
MMLDSAFTLASLPHPIDGHHGRILTATVSALSPISKKRKRSEIAVSVDGEGVNIYSVRASFHALPY